MSKNWNPIMSSSNAAIYLEKMKSHELVNKSQARRAIVIRWVATLCFGSLFPIGVICSVLDFNLLGLVSSGVLFALSISGMLVLTSGWLARKRHGVEGQWGFAQLTSEEVQEFAKMADTDADIGKVVDDLAIQSVQQNSPIRGRDLLFFRRNISKYLKEKKGA